MQDNQKMVFGALGGATAGSVGCLLARGNAVTCALAGIGGGIIGGAIGHSFDERDKARRDAAVQQALYTQGLWQSVPGPLASTATAGATPPAPGASDNTGSTAAEADAAPASAVSAQTAQVPPAKPVVAWQNPDTNNSGAIVPLRTFASPTTGQTCKVYQEDYIKDGKQYSDTMQACPKPGGTFDIKALS